jgi:hypothetical protein
MKYLSWAAFYEGGTDALYFDVLLPRIIRDLIATSGDDLVEVPDIPAVKLGVSDRSIAAVASEVCTFKGAFDLLFIHADAGGRNLEQGLIHRAEAYCDAVYDRCGWPQTSCVTITPRHETEAWLLADSAAVTAALGYNGAPEQVGLPTDARAAERLVDPKSVLNGAIEAIIGRRRRQAVEFLFPAIGQRQDLAALRQSTTFCSFEERLRACLLSLRII